MTIFSALGGVPTQSLQAQGLLGIGLIYAIAYAISNNRKAISWRLVSSGLALQVVLAIFILKIPLGKQLFHWLGQVVERILSFADAGGGFVFGPLVSDKAKMVSLFGPAGGFIFAFKLVPTIIFVATLVAIAYHIGLMQRVVQAIAWAVNRVLGASGAEALSNTASVFVGQVEAQLLIKPYVDTLTQSELLTVMAGSMACIAGGVMAVYIQMGIPAEYLMAASIMAVPGALVISKIVYPETETSLTRGEVKASVETHTVNVIDAAAHGASDGLKIGLNVCAMLIGFIALIAMLDFVIAQLGLLLAGIGLSAQPLGLDLSALSLKGILGALFYWVALALGVPSQDATIVGGLMGTKLVVNEFVAYTSLSPLITAKALAPKSIAIASFALCGFANFSSIAMQIGGIGEMAPSRKADLARLGLRALFCGTAASYVSSALAGILLPPEGLNADSFSGHVESFESFLLPVFVMVLAIGVLVLGVVKHRDSSQVPVE